MDFEYENAPVRIIVSRKCPEIELGGFKIGPFDEGREYEVRFWVAIELEKAGIARIREDELDAVNIYKIQWKERVQSGTQFSSLPQDFYPKLRRYLAGVKEEAVKRVEKMREYEKTMGLSQDVINCRLKKIVSLSSSPAQTNQVLRKLEKEELAIYEQLYNIINEWRSNILGEGGEP
jgi:hypothetical protein